MAIAFDSQVTTASTSGITSKTFSHTTSGSNRILFVIASHPAAQTVTGVTYAGAAMTLVNTRTQTAGNNTVELWYLIAPTIGANNVIITASGSTTIGYGSISFTGASQTSQPNASAVGGNVTTAVTSYAQPVTTTVDSCVSIMGMIAASGATLTAGSNTTIGSQPEITFGGTSFVYSTTAKTPIGADTLTVTSSSQIMVGVMAAIAPVPLTGQILYESSSQGSLPASTSGTFSHTCGTGNNRYLFVLSDDNASGITYAGVAMTKLNSNIVTYNGGFNYVPSTSVWGLVNPASGANNVYIVNGPNNQSFCAVSYTGVDPNGPEAYATNQTNGNQVTFQTDYINTVTNNAWVATFIRGDNSGRAFTAGASTTLRQSNTLIGTTTGILDSNAAKTPVAQYSLTTNWASGSGWFNSVMYSIKPYLTFGFTGPASGNVNAASTNFTVTPDIAVTGTVTITPSGVGSTGLSPTVLTFSNSAVAQTFTITPLTSGAITLTMTNGCGLNNPAALTYTANAVVPTAPVIGIAVPGNTNASISFSPPSSDGGSTITQYRAISTPGSFVNTGTSSPIVVSGLSNGTPYTFTVRATNVVGNSAESSASNSATPYVAATSFTMTGPSSGNVRAASTNFTITPNNIYDGTITITATGTASAGIDPIVLTFAHTSAAQTFTITPSTSGTITLTPTNNNGLANPSNLVYTANAVVPLAPGIGQAFPDDRRAIVYVSEPSNNGGAAVTLYKVTSSPGGIIGSSPTAGGIVINGLTNDTVYTFTATATNSVGESAASSVSNSITPRANSTNFTNNGPKFNIERTAGNLIKF